MGRLYTENGTFVGWAQLANIPRAFYQSVLRKFFGKYPREPYIPFSAAKAIEKVIDQDSVVWEIGAGFSTIWLSSRAKHVTSIEASDEWFARLSEIISSEGVDNVDLRYRVKGHEMSDYSDIPDECLDLLYIDGGPRGECLHNGFPKVKNGGYLYLDNWDNEHFWDPHREFLEQHDSEIESIHSFVDYIPAQIGVYEGLLVKKK